MILETKRLIIRKPVSTDLQDLLAMQNDEVILKYNCTHPMLEEELKQNLAEKAMDERSYVLYHKADHKVIGEINLEEDSLRYQANSIMFSYSLNTHYTKQGYMSEALREVIRYCFEEKQVDLISARVFTENLPSNWLLISLGFTLEGTLRHGVKAYQDVIYDDNLYSLLKNEYEGK